MVLLVRRRPRRLELRFAYHIGNVTILAKVKIEAIVALPPDANDRHFLASTAFDELSYVLPRLDDHLDLVALRVVATHLDPLLVAREEAILAHAIVLAIAAYEEGADDRAHEAVDAFAIAVGREPVA